MKYKYLIEYNNYSHLDPHDEEDWEESDEYPVYLVFKYSSDSLGDKILIGEYYESTKKLFVLRNNSDNEILGFEWDLSRYDRQPLEDSVIDKIKKGFITINCAGSPEFEYTLEDIDKFLDKEIPLIFLTSVNKSNYPI